MSARRQARAAQTATAVQTLGGIPRCLALGPCVEVWAPADLVDAWPHVAAIVSARRRFGIARRQWVEESGMDPGKSWALLPGGRVWSTATAANSSARLRAIGCNRSDLSALAEEADELHSRAELDDPRKAPTS